MARKRKSRLAKFATKVARKARKTAKSAKRKTKKLLRATKAAQKTVKRKLKKRRAEKKRRAAESRRAERERRRADRASRRAEQREEIGGEVDVSAAVIVQATPERGASRPGEPPKMRTGKGRDSIKAEFRKRGNKLISRVYVDKKIAPYMAMWEFRQDGQQRPFLKPALMNNLNMIGETVGTELKQSITRAPKRKAVVK